jgi:hypothetical protein
MLPRPHGAGGRSWDVVFPGTQTFEKFSGPFVSRLEDDLLPTAPYDHLIQVVAKPARFRQPHCLATAVLENLCTFGHGQSIYMSIYLSSSRPWRVLRESGCAQICHKEERLPESAAVIVVRNGRDDWIRTSDLTHPNHAGCLNVTN